MKNGNILVSIIIPVYNVEKYLYSCLDSIVRQKYKNLEIILINDGSTDSSGKIADEYAKSDIRIKVFHKKNEGVSIAKNLGIINATGKFITFVDADDYIRTDFIDNLLKDMTSYRVAVTTTPKIRAIDEDSSESVEVYSQYETLEKLFYGTLEKSLNGVQMFDRQLLVDNNILFDPEKKVGEDFEFFAQAIIACDRIAVDYRKMYYYRPNPTSTMNQSINKGLMKAVTNFSLIGDKLVKKYPTLRRAIDAKKFTDSVSLSIRGYHVRSEWQKDFKDLEYNIGSLKWQILRDKNARTMVRAAALVYCLFGYNVATIILRGLKK